MSFKTILISITVTVASLVVYDRFVKNQFGVKT